MSFSTLSASINLTRSNSPPPESMMFGFSAGSRIWRASSPIGPTRKTTPKKRRTPRQPLSLTPNRRSPALTMATSSCSTSVSLWRTTPPQIRGEPSKWSTSWTTMTNSTPNNNRKSQRLLTFYKSRTTTWLSEVATAKSGSMISSTESSPGSKEKTSPASPASASHKSSYTPISTRSK